MGQDTRFEVIRERANQAIDELACYLAELDQRIAHARAELEAVTPWPRIYFKYSRCSADCTCNDGRGHGPYAYATVRGEDGRAHKRYLGKHPVVPENAVDKTTYRHMERRLEDLRVERERLWGQIGQAMHLLEAPVARAERVM